MLLAGGLTASSAFAAVSVNPIFRSNLVLQWGMPCPVFGVGEVWLMSGQSNMGFPLSNANDSAPYIADAGNHNIRMFGAEDLLYFLFGRLTEDHRAKGCKTSEPSTGARRPALDMNAAKWAEGLTGLPNVDLEGYDRASLVRRAGELHGRLLLVHSTYDDNVHPQNTLAFAEDLIQSGKLFEQMIYPMR